MKTLSANWITENLVDFEYKKYLLLDYLQQVKTHFKDKKLYPDLSEVINHYRNLTELKKSTSSLKENMRKNVNGLDIEHLKLTYENLTDEEWFNEISLIIDFSLPLIGNEVNEGKSIFDFVEKNILFDPVGLLPIHKQEGYFLLNPCDSKQVIAYSYNLSSISIMNREHVGLSVTYFSDYTITISQPVDKIKSELISNNPSMPNPAVYLFRAKTVFPKEETFLPVAKRMLLHAITAS
jgi:hypothetical protein